MNDKFKVTYSNDDGYAGGSRPHSFAIQVQELDEELTEEELSSLFWESIRGDFEQRHLNLFSGSEAEFIAWAKEKIAEMKAENAG